MLGTQLALILVGLFLGADVGIWFTNAALAVGIVWWARGRRHVTKPTNFDHLAERCCLLVIVTFGEMVVDISGYMRSLSLSHFIVSMLAFTLVVGLFLIYDFEYEHLLDHERVSGGTRFMVINSWIVFVLGNIAAGLEYLPHVGVPLVPKSLYLTCRTYERKVAMPDGVGRPPADSVRRGPQPRAPPPLWSSPPSSHTSLGGLRLE